VAPEAVAVSVRVATAEAQVVGVEAILMSTPVEAAAIPVLQRTSAVAVPVTRGGQRYRRSTPR
jgi:hypothetical protein